MTIGRVTTQERLKACEIFSELTHSELEKIASATTQKEYEAGEIIFNGGDVADELLVIQEGKVALQMALPKTMTSMGKKITIDVATRNDAIGWSAVVEPHTYTFSAIGLQKVVALSISGKKLTWLLRENPKTGYTVLNGIVRMVASRLHATRLLLLSEREMPLQ